MNNFKKEKGITLIALVITIIVLLILAGIAVLMLSGENGVLNKAAKAKEEAEEAETIEGVKLAAMSALTVGNGKIQGDESFKTLNEDLDDLEYKGKEVTKLPAKITIKDKQFIIEKDGTVEETIDIAVLKESGKPVSKDKIKLIDENGDIITIPKNFNIVNDSPILVEEGIIIEDSDDNQYVWIPVFEKTEKHTWGVDYSTVKSSNDYKNIEKALKKYIEYYDDSRYIDEWYGDETDGFYGFFSEDDINKQKLIYYTNGNMTKKDYNNLYRNMLKSIYKNNGFYIGRYEMGIGVATSANDENDITSAENLTRTDANKEYVVTSDNKVNEKPTIEGMVNPISKRDAVGYNFITQAQAQMLAKRLGDENDYSKVTTSLMFGVQWNAVCVFIEKCDKNERKLELDNQADWLKNNNYSNLWGNYKHSTFTLDRGYYNIYKGGFNGWTKDYATIKQSGQYWLYTTGAVKQNSSLNIYDLGGNLAEWSLEKTTFNNNLISVYRGMNFAFNASVSMITGSRITNSYYGGTGRVSFYLN